MRIQIIATAAILLSLLGSSAAWAASASCDFGSSGFVHASDPIFASTGLVMVRTEQTSATGSCAGGSADSALSGVVQVIAELPANGPATHTFTQQTSARANGRASPGSLGAFVSATASSTPMAYFYTDVNGDAQATDNNYQATASATSRATFTDELYIRAAVGAHPLSKVSVKFTGLLSGGANIIGSGGVEVTSASLGISQLLGTGGGLLFSTPGVLGSIVLDLWAMEAQPFLGQAPVVNISGILEIFAAANAGMTLDCSIGGNLWCNTDPNEFGNYFAESTAVGDFSSTANFYIEILTAGASYSSGSGVVYATGPAVVPLPAAVWLFGFGLLAMRRIAKR